MEQKNIYKLLYKVVGFQFLVMYGLMYVLVDSLADIFLLSTRPLYMTLVMIPPMVILMLLFMGQMYPNKKLNRSLYAGAGVLFVVAFIFIRGQVFVGDEMFLKSMIPHHSGAITTCQNANLTDPEVIQLCDDIITAQKAEIVQMNNILDRLQSAK